jgi:hypothetical protein
LAPLDTISQNTSKEASSLGRCEVHDRAENTMRRAIRWVNVIILAFFKDRNKKGWHLPALWAPYFEERCSYNAMIEFVIIRKYLAQAISII